MKITRISLLVIAFAVHLNALSQEFNWVQPVHYVPGPPTIPGGGNPGSIIMSVNPRMASDNSRNLYFAGSHKDTIYVDGLRTFTNEYYDGFIIKYTSAGVVEWLTRITGDNDQRIFDIDTDANGNVYITGTYAQGATFGTTDLTGSGMFIAKYTSAGNLVWLKHVNGVQAIYPQRLVIRNEKIYIGGSLTDEPVNFGCSTLGEEDGSKFIAIYNTNGDCQNVYSFDAAYLNDLAVDTNNNIYVAGGFIESATFGTIALEAEFEDYYLSRLNANGTWTWANQMATQEYAGQAMEVEVSPSTGEIILAGYFSNTADFGGVQLTSVEASDLFVAAYDDAGNLQWVSAGTGNGNQYAFAMSIDNAGEILLSGSIIDDTQFGNFSIATDSEITFVAHYASNGSCLGVTSVTGGQSRGVDLLALNGIAYLAVEVYTSGNFSFDDITQAAKQSDVFATQLSYKEVVLGTEKNELNQVTVYPNPFASALTIDFGTQDSRQTTITVKNTLGQTVATYRPQLQEGKSMIEPSLPPGVYFVSIVENNRSVTRKVIKN